MKKKKKNNKKKIIIILIAVVIVFAGIFVAKSVLFKEKAAPVAKVVDKLDDYGYTLEDDATKYYKGLFNDLKKTLSKDNVDEEEYAKLVSQLFLADYFNLENKISKNDVGGVQYVYTPYQESFIKKSMDEVYRYVESDIYGDRKQELPVVSSVDVNDIKTITHEYGDQTDEKAYSVDLSISYEEDMGYQANATLVLVHNKNKLEIVKMS